MQDYKESGEVHLPLKMYLTKLCATKNIAETKATIVNVCKTFRGISIRSYESDDSCMKETYEHLALTLLCKCFFSVFPAYLQRGLSKSIIYCRFLNNLEFVGKILDRHAGPMNVRLGFSLFH